MARSEWKAIRLDAEQRGRFDELVERLHDAGEVARKHDVKGTIEVLLRLGYEHCDELERESAGEVPL